MAIVKSIKLFIFREILIVLLSGGIPIILAYCLGGIELLESTTSALISPELLFNYAISIAGLFFVFYWADYLIYIYPLSWKKGAMNFIVSTLSELSTNILGILRVISGLLIVFPILVFVEEPQSFKFDKLVLIFVGFLGLLESCIFCWCHSKVSVKQKFKWLFNQILNHIYYR